MCAVKEHASYPQAKEETGEQFEFVALAVLLCKNGMTLDQLDPDIGVPEANRDAFDRFEMRNDDLDRLADLTRRRRGDDG